MKYRDIKTKVPAYSDRDLYYYLMMIKTPKDHAQK
jgi:hypothetical protein